MDTNQVPTPHRVPLTEAAWRTGRTPAEFTVTFPDVLTGPTGAVWADLGPLTGTDRSTVTVAALEVLASGSR